VSVVIPCFNQGIYLDDALNSVFAQTFPDIETVIVDDGSTDESTIKILDNVSYPAVRVIRTVNKGPSAARNLGIMVATGEYILPLDADDLIAPQYIEEAVNVLEGSEDYRIVYCKAEKFGAQSGVWPSPDFSLRRMLMGNQIFCSAVFRKSDWEKVGGYNLVMTAGYEDWDFWLSILEQGGTAFRIPHTRFYYRIKDVSRTTVMDCRKKVEMHLQIMRNHPQFYIENIKPLLEIYYRIAESLPYRVAKKLRLPYLISVVVWRR